MVLAIEPQKLGLPLMLVYTESFEALRHFEKEFIVYQHGSITLRFNVIIA